MSAGRLLPVAASSRSSCLPTWRKPSSLNAVTLVPCAPLTRARIGDARPSMWRRTLRPCGGCTAMPSSTMPTMRWSDDGARGVEVREPDPELASVAHVVLPEDLAGGDDDHALPRVEPTRDGLTDLGQVRGTEVHALFGEVDRLRLERRTESAANLDHPIERDPRRVWRAAIACSAHENSPLDALRKSVPCGSHGLGLRLRS